VATKTPVKKPAAKLSGFRRGPMRVLRISQGPFVPVGHNAPLPTAPSGFGSPKFSADEQAANPDRPMTRLVKDVLRTGKWAIDIDSKSGKPLFWAVDAGTLTNLAANFQLATSRGAAINLTLSHGNPKNGLVPTDELVAPIDATVVEGGTLWVAVYVTPEQAKFLQNPAMKVSVGVWDGWVDGHGNQYDQALIHVAVTDHPVIPGQGPFLKLANSQKGGTMDFAALLELVNSMLPGQLSLPEDTTEENIVERLQLVLMTLAGGEAPAAPDAAASEAGSEAATEEMAASQNQPAAGAGPMMNLMKDVVGTMKALSAEVAQLKAGRVNEAKAAFTAAVQGLCSNGLPAAEGTKLLGLGAKYGWDQDLLATVKAPGKKAPAGRSLATSQSGGIASSTETGRARLSDDEIKGQLAKQIGAEAADKFFPKARRAS
jgi:hypothetical protein